MSYIWIPKTIIEPEPITLRSGIGGRFKLTAIRPDGRERPLTDWFHNIVLDQGLDAVAGAGDGPDYLNCCRVGTGNTAPAANQTNLVAHIAGTSSITTNNTSNSGASEYYASRTLVYRFGQGAAAGNLAEVGIGNGTGNGNNLFSRELIRDGVGAPTTITVLSDEFLDVAYECRYYPATAELAGVGGSVSIASVSYTTLIKTAGAGTGSWGIPGANVMDATAYSGSLGAVTSFPGGSSSAASSTSTASYTPGSFTRDFTANWGLSNGNVGGIAAVAVSWRATLGGNNNGASQMSFSPAIPKDGTKLMSLVFRRAWARKTI